MTKTCTRCDRVQSIQEFWRKSDSADGFHTVCKSCARAYQKSREGDPRVKELAAAGAKRYRDRHRQIIRYKNRQQARAAYRANPEVHRRRTKADYQKNKSRRQETTRRWNVQHAERLRFLKRKSYHRRVRRFLWLLLLCGWKPLSIAGTRRCARCGLEKPADEFRQRSWCKPCAREYRKQFYNTESSRAGHRRWAERQRLFLSDHYVKQFVPAPLTEAKAAQLKLKRLCRNLKTSKNSGTNS